ncbi:MAG TPA: hypothetical protein VKY33_06480 [Flavobacterium sp.]|nr:hypothetical protein [Flavobacterium sp.]
MKKIIGLLTVSAFLTACDDGDMVFENLNFDNVQIQKCIDNELYFKINNNELLLVDFTRNISSTQKGSWLDPEVELDLRTSPPVNADIKTYYRTYDGTVNNNVICSIIAPANPKVTSEYVSVPGGTIFYTRTMTPTVNEGTVNIFYAFTIEFQNITLTDGVSEIKYTNLPFGSYAYESTRLTFSIPKITYCSEENVLTGHNAISDFFKLKLPDNFQFPTTATTQTIQLNDNQNFSYIVYSENLSNTEPCDTISKPIKEEWAATEGTVTIETQTNATGQRHLVKIQNALFTKENGSFVMTDREIGTYDIEN